MITEIFSTLYYGYRKTTATVASLSRAFSRAVCPDEHLPNLEGCYRQADFARAQIQALSTHPTIETCFLADLFEISDEFDNFFDLMQFWAGFQDSLDQEERHHYPRTVAIMGSAEKFIHHFDSLPTLVQRAANAGLSAHKALFIRAIEGGSTRFIRSEPYL